ncbi:hypothetical protein M427DRAFT_152799 [Gonapodya prolifera JEL478]|uniref:C2H2-type domain-containing protein n=1 Tax=Gonapodya prolifera (strain JEL478) TaxID=1344416 RepID=A0A139APW0_GONPJ|nr:hypothetical protein M427DRAFT_152799 [Gonapodya prolifera JEL478]|eukprot:KXS18791.1 hypothetical protein M427DRAFT_152799 [Gonapodya prolifera JEL478]
MERDPKPPKKRRAAAREDIRCDVRECGRRFSTRGHLKRHVLTFHSDDRPYECGVDGCPARFSRMDNCRQHQRVHRRYGDALPARMRGSIRKNVALYTARPKEEEEHAHATVAAHDNAPQSPISTAHVDEPAQHVVEVHEYANEVHDYANEVHEYGNEVQHHDILAIPAAASPQVYTDFAAGEYFAHPSPPTWDGPQMWNEGFIRPQDLNVNVTSAQNFITVSHYCPQDVIGSHSPEQGQAHFNVIGTPESNVSDPLEAFASQAIEQQSYSHHHHHLTNGKPLSIDIPHTNTLVPTSSPLMHPHFLHLQQASPYVPPLSPTFSIPTPVSPTSPISNTQQQQQQQSAGRFFVFVPATGSYLPAQAHAQAHGRPFGLFPSGISPTGLTTAGPLSYMSPAPATNMNMLNIPLTAAPSAILPPLPMQLPSQMPFGSDMSMNGASSQLAAQWIHVGNN